MTNDKRPRGLIAAVVLLAVLLGGAVLVLLLGPAGPTGRTAPPSALPSGSVSIAPVEPAQTQVALTEAPSSVTWELFQGVALPVSATDGPARITGAVHSGFARSPTGALIADAQINIRRVATPAVAGLRQIAEEQLAPGPGKTAYLNLIASLRDNAPPAGGYTQYIGFRYLTYTPDLAVISLATRGKSGRIQVGTDTLRWLAGDWKLELPASGLQQPQVVQDITGYVPWQGVS